MEKFKFFISFGGVLSDNVAQHLKALLKLLQAIEGWSSSQDLPKGEEWFPELKKRLQQRDMAFAILVVTPDSLDSRWQLIESTALLVGLGFDRVFPVLVDVKAEQLLEPTSRLNATNIRDRDDLLRLMQRVNDLTNRFVAPETVKELFDNTYEVWNRKLHNIVASHPPAARKATLDDVMNEVQGLKRVLASRVTVVEAPPNLPSNNIRPKRAPAAASARDFREVIAAAAKRPKKD